MSNKEIKELIKENGILLYRNHELVAENNKLNDQIMMMQEIIDSLLKKTGQKEDSYNE